MIENRILIENKWYVFSDFDFSLFDPKYTSLFDSGILEVSNGGIRFRFVGALLLNDTLFFVLPKYYRNQKITDPQKHCSLVFETLKKASKYASDVYNFDIELLNSSYSVLSLYIDLLKHYETYGLFTRSLRINTSSDTGCIDWDRTIQKETAYFTKKGPVYLETSNTKSINTNDNIVAEVQKECILKGYKILRYFYNYLTKPQFKTSSLLSYFEKEEILVILRKELSITYQDKDIYLLKLLISIITNEKDLLSNNTVEIIGTRSFHVIWELATKFVLKDQAKQEQKHIPFPVWHYENRALRSTGTYIPDILINKNPSFIILDAKYYLPKAKTDTIINEPGTESISKQIIYQQIFETIYPNLSIKNAFIFPETQDINTFELLSEMDINNKGKVVLKGLEKYSIDNVFISPTKLFYSFINNKKIELDASSLNKRDVVESHPHPCI